MVVASDKSLDLSNNEVAHVLLLIKGCWKAQNGLGELFHQLTNCRHDVPLNPQPVLLDFVAINGHRDNYSTT